MDIIQRASSGAFCIYAEVKQNPSGDKENPTNGCYGSQYESAGQREGVQAAAEYYDSDRKADRRPCQMARRESTH